MLENRARQSDAIPYDLAGPRGLASHLARVRPVQRLRDRVRVRDWLFQDRADRDAAREVRDRRGDSLRLSWNL